MGRVDSPRRRLSASCKSQRLERRHRSCYARSVATECESPRDCRRLPELRGWEYDKAEAVFS